jgi:hypothetical protein
LAGDDDYLKGATSINHQVALRANFKMYSFGHAAAGEKIFKKSTHHKGEWFVVALFGNGSGRNEQSL